MFIDKLTKREKSRLASGVIETYNMLSEENKIPKKAEIKLDNDNIFIKWEDVKLGKIARKKICISDFEVCFIGLDDIEEVEKFVFYCMQGKFPEYKECYASAHKQELYLQYLANVKEFQKKLIRLTSDDLENDR